MFTIKRRQKCLVCQERFIIYKYIFIPDICKK